LGLLKIVPVIEVKWICPPTDQRDSGTMEGRVL
jgi:hypothetical protein